MLLQHNREMNHRKEKLAGKVTFQQQLQYLLILLFFVKGGGYSMCLKFNPRLTILDFIVNL